MDTYGDDTGLAPVMVLADKFGVAPLAIYQLAASGAIQLYREKKLRPGSLVDYHLVDERQVVRALAQGGH